MTALIDRTLVWGTLAAASLFALYAFDADAQTPGPVCAPFADMSKELERHKEVQIAGGVITGDESFVIVFGEPTGKTWTLVAVGATGTACIIASGEGWFQSDLMTGQPV